MLLKHLTNPIKYSWQTLTYNFFYMQQRFTLYKPAIFRILVLVAGICCMPPALLAGPGQSPVIQVLDGSQGQLAKDSFNVVSDTMFFDPAFNTALVKPYLVRNTITFRIDPYSKYALQGNFTATVKLELTRTAADGSMSVLDTALTVRYTTDSLVTDGDRYLFSNSYSVKVKVLDRSSNVSWDVWKCLKLENELQSFPVFTFHCDTDTILSLAHAALDSATRVDELPVSWSAVTSADQYDLEWTYIDSSALKNPLHLYGNPGPDPTLVFDNNASRVTITGTNYNIPIFYDGTGTLFFRVRPVQLQAVGGRTEGHWTTDHAQAASFYFKGHQPNLNWQATSSYAEEGKRKVVLQYYDGSLRGRQTVTKDNSTNTTIVAESYYDYQGRPTVQVLPAPTFSNVIQYSRNFNLGMNGAYDKNDFDSLNDASAYCSSGASPMPTNSGASLYYSPSNPEKDSGINKYIPDAKGYPFTQVEYVQDNTGRISRQSGVGPDHRLGSGHETKYFYGTPDQRELDALFGTEVGDHSHYFKTMVRDANGQYSVSYTDMHGRTIATALAGAPPDSIRLDTLSSYKAQNITETLSDAGSNTVHDLVMESKKGLLVSVGGENLFQYKLDPASLQLPDCNNRAVCYDCLYDLEITMTDDCNNQKLGGHAFDTVFHNFSLSGPIDTSCNNNAGSFAVSFYKYLEEGSYEITKRLSVSQYGESYYRDSVFMKRNMCRTMNTFLQDQRAIQAAITQCQPTCQSCSDSLGTFSAYYQRFVTRAGIATGDTSYDAMIRTAYQQAQDDCKALCNLANQQDDVYHAMLLDLTPPSGQYANATSTKDVNSIFYPRPPASGDDTVADYQLINNYVDDNGAPDLVYDEASGIWLTPQNLTPQVFSEKFKLSWAQALLPKHPEYKKYVAYQTLAQSSAWDKRFESVDNYAEALQKGYLNPTNNSSLPYGRYAATAGMADYDPLPGIASPGTNYRATLENKLLNFMPKDASNNLTLWEYATASIKCAGKANSCFTAYFNNDSAFATTSCGGDNDMAWRAFRQAYLDIKQTAINTYLKTIDYLPPTTTFMSLLAAGHQPHFTDAAEITSAAKLTPPADTAAARAQAQAALNGYYDSTCRAYVTMWWQDLKPCNYNSTDSAAIIPLLIQVCKEGSDGNHPYGASSVAPTSSNQYRSFEDVINAYNQNRGTPSSANCNAYSITAPAPYDQQVIYSNKPLWTKPSDCECTQIQSIYANYQATIGHYTSFSDYLHRAYQTDISDTDLSMLMNLCSTDPAVVGCNYLATPIQLPPALQCNAGDICVGSTKFKSLDSLFRSEFPGVVPVVDPNPLDSVQVSADKLYENFMNAHLGFSKTSAEYLDFLSKSFGSTSGVTDSLQKILADFNASWYPDTVSNDSVHFAIGLPFGDDLHLMPSIYPQVFSNGIAHIPQSLVAATPYAGSILTILKNDTICNLNNNFTIEARIKADSTLPIGICRGNNFIFWDTYPSIAFSPTFGNLDDDIFNCGYGLWSCNGDCSWDTVNGGKYLVDVYSWMKIKMVLNNGTINLYLNDTLIRTATYPTPINRITRFGVGDGRGYTDYVKIYDGNGVLQYSEEFEDSKQSASNYPPALSCKGTWQSAFTTYFNQTAGRNYTFAQIEYLYQLQGVNLLTYKDTYWTADTVVAGVPPLPCGVKGYIKNFTANGGEKTRDMITLADGSHLVAGYYHPGGGTNVDAFIAKTDRNGANLWYKGYGGSEADNFIRIKNTSDGGFVALGNTSSFTNTSLIWVVKGDTAGNVQWTRTLDGQSPHTELGVDIIQTADGGYAVAANYDTLAGSVDWEIVRLSSTGTTLWAEHFGSSSSDNAGGLIEDQGALIFSGLFLDAFSEYSGMIMKLNETTGTISWARGYSIDGRKLWLRDIHNTANGYVVNGVTTNNFGVHFGEIQQTVLETDKNGLKTRIQQYTPFVTDSGLVVLNPNPGGGYTITQDEENAPDIFVTKVDQNGSIVHTNRIMLDSAQMIGGLARNPDGGFEAIGFSGSNAMLLRMDSLGRTACRDSGVSLTMNPPAVSEQDQNYTPHTFTIDNEVRTMVPVSRTAIVTDVCSGGISCSLAVKDSLFLCGRAAPVFAPVSLNTITNCSDSSFFEVSKSTELFNAYSDSLHGKFDSLYRAKCMQAYLYESFTVTHIQSEFHYTLYYYDQAGNLLKTVPPGGVNANYDSLWLNSVAAARLAGGSLVPTHGLLTQYRYNTLNQVMAQQTPDGGRSYFWYDRLGRLSISQNARQRSVTGTEQGRQYSYTLYDFIGRITEVGQINNTGTVAMTDSISRSESLLTAWITASAAGKEQITQTVYDLAYPGFSGVPFVPVVQRNLRNRVSYTSYTSGGNPTQYNQRTFYTYDIEGNVDTLLQDYGSSSTGVANIMNMNGNRFKRLVYQYDLVSGKVNSVAYQPHQVDAFYHRYTYDAENRLILAETSQDSVYWDKDARYDYYKHGPLARETIGDKQVQGLDYAYTLQGWLKGVNSTSLSPLYDMGLDGDTSHQNRYIARDAYGYSLNYFTGDYTAIGTGVAPFPGSSAYLNAAYRPLFNGNISSMVVNLAPLYKTAGAVTDNSHWRGPMLYNYQYDQLNRITGMDAFYGLDQTANSWSGLQPTADFRERVGYDGNGNIQRYVRNNFGETGQPMDSLGYKYLAGTNQLDHIADTASDAIGGGYDLHNQPVGNYKYDSIGNLIRDSSEKISAIKWNVYGKITEIDHLTTSVARPTKNIYYFYDAAGNRVGKKTTRGDNTTASYTWYVRDASGNVMATYTAGLDSSKTLDSADLHIGEKHIYGSSRLGIVNADYSTDANTDGLSIYTSPWIGAHVPYYTGQKQYELVNHLGNVLATITDKKIGISLGTDSSLIDHYEADVRTAQDYYPFGMVMPGRMFTAISIPGGAVSGQSQVNGYTLPVDLDLTARGDDQTKEYVATQMIDLDNGFVSGDVDDVTLYIADTSYAGTGNGPSSDALVGNGKYRYGFNGKENDNEVKGEGDQVDYGKRIYDPRVGRFMSVDPLQREYAMLAPYQYSGNNPIAGVDLDGREFDFYLASEYLEKKMFGTTHLKNIRDGVVDQALKDVKEAVHSIKTILNSKGGAPIYGSGFTTLLGGIPPGFKSQEQKEFDASKEFVKGIVKDFGELIHKAATAKGEERDKAIGALGFEVALLIAPGADEADGLKFEIKQLSYLKDVVPIAQKTIFNSEGQAVIRNFVRNEDDLLKIAENAAGGSLDNFVQKEGKNWWYGEVDGEQFRIEWEPEGHNSTNEGPHVRIQKWVEGAGEKGKGKWDNGEKYFIQNKEQLVPNKTKKK